MSDSRPIAVFDSGLGGLSVASEIHALLPHEDLLYLADTAYCPYGGRSLDQIRERSLAVAAALVERNAKALVVACNTASGAALEALRERFELPIVGLEPAVKPAVALSRSAVGVMATPATLKTERFQRLIKRFAPASVVIAQACPGLVELVETGAIDSDDARQLLEELLAPLREAKVDVVVLGCTHYPFLRAHIEAAMGRGVTILDSGLAVAQQVERVLGDAGRLTEGSGGFHLLTTGDAAEVGRVAEWLWGQPIRCSSVVVPFEWAWSPAAGG